MSYTGGDCSIGILVGGEFEMSAQNLFCSDVQIE